MERNNMTREEAINEIRQMSLPKHRGKSYSAYLDLSLNEVEACMLRYFHSAESRKNDFEINEDTRKYAKDLIGIIQRSDEPQIVDAFKNYTDNGITITCGEFEAKPMFKEGDWVVYDGVLGHAILKIKDIKDGRYTFVDNESTLLAEDSGKYLRPLTPNDIKPAEWTEEDERILKGIIGLIDHDQHYGVSNNEMISWLNSLRPQHRAKTNDYITPHKEFFEWIYNRLINVHNENPNVDYMQSFKKRIDNLQFDEPHWKPSEEQIATLEQWLKDKKFDGASRYIYPIFESLYEQLKKLM